MDMITDLPLSNGYDSILTVVDHGLTKGIITIPCNKTVDHEQVAQLLIDNLYKRFGLPDSIISDRGPQFAAKAFREMLKLLNVTSLLTTAYHPQGDGSTERFNQEVEAYLAIYCSAHPEDWSSAISTLEFTHNNRRHADRLRTPFELMYGTSPLALPTSFENTKYPHIEERIKNLTKNREEALAAHEIARSRMADRRTSKFTPFKIGQKVWLTTKNLKIDIPKKFKPKEEGPFKIIHKYSDLTYKLELPPDWKIHNNFHAIMLKPFVENEVHGPSFLRPPPDIINEEEEYEVERIDAHRRHGTGYKYLIRWKGYPVSERSWEPEEALANTRLILDTYKQKHRLSSRNATNGSPARQRTHHTRTIHSSNDRTPSRQRTNHDTNTNPFDRKHNPW